MSPLPLPGCLTHLYMDATPFGIPDCSNYSLLEGNEFLDETPPERLHDQVDVLHDHHGEPITHMPDVRFMNCDCGYG